MLDLDEWVVVVLEAFTLKFYIQHSLIDIISRRSRGLTQILIW